ncbi:MAG: hypothetical protein RR477_07605, partial [Raoultibacter sp.]
MSALSPAAPAASPATTPPPRATDAAVPYLNLDPAIEAAITRDRANGWHNPHRFEDGAVVRRAAANHDQATLTRPAFGRDIEKIINVPAYNRYAGKTQV